MGITKVVKKTLKCGVTGEWYTVYQNVTVPDQYAAIREAREKAIDAQADAEAAAMGRHRAIRPSVQKIGWM